jgi:DNA-binding HxlR family transcriptional regulator
LDGRDRLRADRGAAALRRAREGGLSDRLLSQRLRELEDAGVVQREVEEGTPTRVIYSLTEKGADLRPTMFELRAWARRWKSTV